MDLKQINYEQEIDRKQKELIANRAYNEQLKLTENQCWRLFTIDLLLRIFL
jgi:hypothetical protein